LTVQNDTDSNFWIASCTAGPQFPSNGTSRSQTSSVKKAHLDGARMPCNYEVKSFFAPRTRCGVTLFESSPIRRAVMSEVVYVSKIKIERKSGPLRIAYLPGESQPVTFSVHGAIAKHYKVDPAKIGESHASTLDYVIASTAG
jgi:hypothetical protein